MILQTPRIALNSVKYGYHTGYHERKVAHCRDCHWMGSRNVLFCPICRSNNLVEPPHPDDFDQEEIPWDDLNEEWELESSV